jgi:hypothetical protein
VAGGLRHTRDGLRRGTSRIFVGEHARHSRRVCANCPGAFERVERTTYTAVAVVFLRSRRSLGAPPRLATACQLEFDETVRRTSLAILRQHCVPRVSRLWVDSDSNDHHDTGRQQLLAMHQVRGGMERRPVADRSV